MLKPAALGNVKRQDLALEFVFRPVLKRLGKAAAQNQRAMFDERRGGRGAPRRRRLVFAELEPVKAVWRQREQVRQLSDARESRAAQKLDGRASGEFIQFQFDGLCGTRDVDHAEDGVVLVFAQVRQHFAVLRQEKPQTALPECLVTAALDEHAPQPVEQRVRIAPLRFHVHRLITPHRIHDRREHERRRIGAAESAVAVRGPLHRRAHAVAVAQMDVVPHADFVAVIDDRCPRHSEKQAVHQFDAAPVVL